MRGWSHSQDSSGDRRVDEVEHRLAAVFATVFGIPIERVRPDLGPMTFEQWDSIGHLTLIAAVEEAFAIRLHESEVLELTSFGSLVDIIRGRQLQEKPLL